MRIAKRVTVLLNQTPIVPIPATIARMGELSHQMLTQSLDAFVKRDIAVARGLADIDAQVDTLEDEANAQIRDMIKNDIATLESGLILIEITYMLERLADRTTNIGERVIFMINNTTEALNQ